VTFFRTWWPADRSSPQLVPQFESPGAPQNNSCWKGSSSVAGLFMKVTLGRQYARRIGNTSSVPTARASLMLDGHLAFAGQIFLDFAGYSTAQ